MNAAKREALQKAGFQLGTVQDFLGLNDWECRVIELKCSLRKTARRLREANHLTQQDVAKRIRSSQSRVAKIEAGSEDVSLDLLIRYLFAVGGSLRELDEAPKITGESVEARPAKKVSTSTKKKGVLVS